MHPRLNLCLSWCLKEISTKALFGLYDSCLPFSASLVAQLVENPLAMQETWLQFLGWEDPLKKGKAAHSSILI